MRWLLKRWWFWGGMLFMLVATCAGYLLIPVEEPRISQANYDSTRDDQKASGTPFGRNARCLGTIDGRIRERGVLLVR